MPEPRRAASKRAELNAPAPRPKQGRARWKMSARIFTALSRSLHNRVTARAAPSVKLIATMEVARLASDEILQIGDLEIRPAGGLCLAAGRALALSVREFQVLVALARSVNRIVSREDLHTRVWGGPLRNGDRSVDVYVHKLRVKLEAALPGSRLIQTHVGFGYRLDA
jgi:DNA-binding response OmpR family regulator